MALALLYFVVTRIDWLPFAAYDGFLVNQAGVVSAAYLLTVTRRDPSARFPRAFGAVAVFVFLIWGIADYATNVARLPSTIDDARLGERISCQARLDSAAQHASPTR